MTTPSTGSGGALPQPLDELCREPVACYVATTMPDGSPQLTQTWVDSDGDHVIINTVVGHQKDRNVLRDPRVALNISDPSRPSRYWFVRGTVVERRTEGAAEHIDSLSHRYTGEPYPWYGGHDQQRVIWHVRVDSTHPMG